MKKFTLIIFVTTLAFAANAQTLSLSHNDADVSNDTVYLIHGGSDIYMDLHLTIQNSADKDVDVHLKRSEISLADNSTNSFCWGPYCYPPFISESNEPVNITAKGENSSSFLGEYYPPLEDTVNVPVPGTSIIRYTFFLDGTPSDSVSVLVHYQVGASGIQDWTIQPELFAVYPNPTSGLLNLSFPGSLDQAVELRVINLTGQTVLQKDLYYGSTQTQIDLSRVPRGYYFVQIRNQSGSMAQKKILKSN